MKFYTYGEYGKPTFLLIPDKGCRFDAQYGQVISYLTPFYYVICASFDGFDPIDQVAARPLSDEIIEIEFYITKRFNKEIDAAYGSGAGGRLLTAMLGRHRIAIEHIILDQVNFTHVNPILACLQSHLYVFFHYKMFKLGKHQSENKEKAMMPFLKPESLYTQIFSNLTLRFAKVSAFTKVTIINSQKNKRRDRQYKTIFAHPALHISHHPLNQLLLSDPKRWSEAVRECLYA